MQVTANGGQRFLVEVTLTITGRMAVRVDRLPLDAEYDMDQVLAVVPAATHVASERETIPEVLAATEDSPTSVRRGRDEIVDVLAIPLSHPLPSPVLHPIPGSSIENENDNRKGRMGGFLKHLLPLAVIALFLLSVVAHDLWLVLFSSAKLVDPNPYIAIRFHDAPDDKLPMPTMRFGLVMLRPEDPTHPDRLKRLTFDERGRSNNTCLRVDGDDYLFGQPPGTWIEMKGKLEGSRDGRPRDGLASSWQLAQTKIKVTQEVEIVPGEQSRRLDTCLVRYVIENKDTHRHSVGIRFMLDTFIGFNDGVPFTIPGATDLCDTKKLFRTSAEVPDFIQALEKDNLSDPGTVAYLQFRIGNQVESPSRVMLGGWPNPELQTIGWKTAKAQLTGWDVPFLSIKERIGRQTANDSAVTMYWDPQPLAPDQTRVVGFTYGLGEVDTRESGGHLLLTVGGRLVRNGEFTLTALVHNPQPGEKLTLTLPPGFSIVKGDATQAVPPVPAGAMRTDSPVTLAHPRRQRRQV